MNNSRIALEEPLEQQIDLAPKLREEESKVTRIIEALREVSASKGWSTLKEELFDKLVNSLERDLRVEARKDDPDPKKLNRLSGELKWAERFSDLSKLEHVYKLNLQNIRSNPNYGTTD